MKADTIFLVNKDGGLEEVPQSGFVSEDVLQTLVEDYPDILAGGQIDPDDPPRWLLVQREAGIPDAEGAVSRWSVDHLLLDQRGRPTFVEVKRSTDTRIRREVVGQMLDYAANAKVYWPQDRIRALAAEQYGGVDSLDTRLQEFLGADDSTNTEQYWEAVERHLRTGEVRLLFVADSIPTELRRIIEFLNEHMPLVEVLGVEIKQYEGRNVRALVPRVVGQTESARQKKAESSGPRIKQTPEAFLASCSAESAKFFTSLFSEADNHGCQISWGTKGFSMRFPSHSGELVSIFYGYPGELESEPKFQAYLGFVKDPARNQSLRSALVALGPFQERGKHTLDVSVNLKTAGWLVPRFAEMLGQAKDILSNKG